MDWQLVNIFTLYPMHVLQLGNGNLQQINESENIVEAFFIEYLTMMKKKLHRRYYDHDKFLTNK